ncbi:31069_t:CDS:2, partial [Racocetra persica]
MDFTNKESAEMINDNLLNSNELDLNNTVYFESETTIPLDYSDTYNNSVPSEDDYHNISNYYNNSVRSDDNNYMATQSCNSVDEDELDNNGTDDELHLELVVGILFSCWDFFKAWLNRFALQKGPNVTVDPTKHPRVKINSFCNVHNHPLTSMVNEIATRYRKLTPDMLSDIE